MRSSLPNWFLMITSWAACTSGWRGRGMYVKIRSLGGVLSGSLSAVSKPNFVSDVWSEKNEGEKRKGRILQENTRWKALDEIYKIYMLLHRSDLNISEKIRQTFSHVSANWKFCKTYSFSKHFHWMLLRVWWIFIGISEIFSRMLKNLCLSIESHKLTYVSYFAFLSAVLLCCQRRAGAACRARAKHVRLTSGPHGCLLMSPGHGALDSSGSSRIDSSAWCLNIMAPFGSLRVQMALNISPNIHSWIVEVAVQRIGLHYQLRKSWICF